jgi:hypothetical protein
VDVGAYSIMSLESGPFLTMLTLGVAGLSTFPWQTLLGAILPLLVGMLIGNLDGEMREFLGRATPALIPFFAFALGAGLDLGKVWQAGLLGVSMGVATIVLTGIPLYLVDRLWRQRCRRRRGRQHGRECGSGADDRRSGQPGVQRGCEPSDRPGCCLRRGHSHTGAPGHGDGRAPSARRRPGPYGLMRLLIVADDVSGAADCAAGCVPSGLRTVVLLDAEADASGYDVVAVDTDSRHLAPALAADAHLSLLQRLSRARPSLLYQKIDSTRRPDVSKAASRVSGT